MLVEGEKITDQKFEYIKINLENKVKDLQNKCAEYET